MRRCHISATWLLVWFKVLINDSFMFKREAWLGLVARHYFMNNGNAYGEFSDDFNDCEENTLSLSRSLSLSLTHLFSLLFKIFVPMKLVEKLRMGTKIWPVFGYYAKYSFSVISFLHLPRWNNDNYNACDGDNDDYYTDKEDCHGHKYCHNDRNDSAQHSIRCRATPPLPTRRSF